MMIDTLTQHSVIPVVEIESAKDSVALAEALLAGGIGVIEITLRTDAGVAAIAAIREHCPAMLVGAGTVLTVAQSQSARDAGAQFGVAPGLNPDIIKSFQDEDIAFLPGVVTPSEIEFAVKLGCRYLKFFPAGASGGPPYLRALSGPYAAYDIAFCATGGVSLSNMNDYLSLPLVRAIGGSWIATRQQIAAQQWREITLQARQAINQLAARET
jgi:2-dehydro-3-deoxyphosphogluconate aldolase / (4S)-4-hydroxy-2-oxoglutarate aldolase